jgi:CspA family cold shock protein
VPLYLRRSRRKLKSVTDGGVQSVFGTIKKIVKDKGFGFIIPDDGTDEVFFHRSKLYPKVQFDDLREGNEVQFEVRPGDKGPQAFNLRLR